MTRTRILVLCLLLITELVRANPILQRMASQFPLVNYPSCPCKRSSPYEALARSIMMPANNMHPNNRMCTAPNPMARPCPKAQTSQSLEQMLMDTVLTNPSLKSIVDPNSMVDIMPQNQPPVCRNALPVVNNYIIIPTDFGQNDTDFNLDRYNIPKLVSKIKQNVAQNRRAECMPCDRRKNNCCPRCPIERNGKQRKVAYVKEKMVPRRGNLEDAYYNYESEIEYDSAEEDRDRRTVTYEEEEDIFEPENAEKTPVEEVNMPKNERNNKRIRNRTRQRPTAKNKQQKHVEPSTRKNERVPIKRRRYQNRKQTDTSNLDTHFNEDNTGFSNSASELHVEQSSSTSRNKETNRRNGYQNSEQDKISTANAQLADYTEESPNSGDSSNNPSTFEDLEINQEEVKEQPRLLNRKQGSDNRRRIKTKVRDGYQNSEQDKISTANAQLADYTEESPNSGDSSNNPSTLEDLEIDEEEVKEPPRLLNRKQGSDNRRRIKTKVTEEYLDDTENIDDVSHDDLYKKESKDDDIVEQESINTHNRMSSRRQNGNKKENYTLKNQNELVDTDTTVDGTIQTTQNRKNKSPTVNGQNRQNRKMKSRRRGSENRKKPKTNRTKENLEEGLEIEQHIPDSISTPQDKKKEKPILQNRVSNSDRTKSRTRNSGNGRQKSMKKTKTNRNDKVLENLKQEVITEENLDNINNKIITRKGGSEKTVVENAPSFADTTTEKVNDSNILTAESSLENQSSAPTSSEESLEQSTHHSQVNQIAIEHTLVKEHPLQTSSLVEQNPSELTLTKQSLVKNSVENSPIEQYQTNQKPLIHSLGEPTPFEKSSEEETLIEEPQSEQSSLEDLSVPDSTEQEEMEISTTTLPPKITPSRTENRKMKPRRGNISQKPKPKSNNRNVNRFKNISSRPSLVDKKIDDPVNSENHNLSPENRLTRNSKDEAFIKEARYKYPELPEEAVRYFLTYAKNHHPNQVQSKGQRLPSGKNKNRPFHPTYPNPNHLKQRRVSQTPQENGSKRKPNRETEKNKQKIISQEAKADIKSKKCLQNNLTNPHSKVVELTPTIMYIAPENSTAHQDIEDKSKKNLGEVEKTNDIKDDKPSLAPEVKSENGTGEMEKYSKSKDEPLVPELGFDDSVSTMNEDGIIDHLYPLLFESGAYLTSEEFNDLRSLSSDRYHYTTDKNFDRSSIQEAKIYEKVKNINYFEDKINYQSEKIKNLEDENKFYLNNEEEKENFEDTIPRPEQISGVIEKENYYQTKPFTNILQDSEELEFRTPPGLEIPDFETRNIISREQYELLSRLRNEIFDDSPVYSNAKLKIDAPSEIMSYTEPKEFENVKVYGQSKVVRYGFHEPDDDSTVVDDNIDNGLTTERQAALIFAKSLSNPEDFW